jgi:hypothetical protein
MICPDCGHDNPGYAVRCAACRTSLLSEADTAPPEAAPEPSSPPPISPAQGGPADYPATARARPTKPDNYLVWAIVATLFCCWPAGIPAIVYAAQVDAKYNAGDYLGARESADKAQFWTWLSVGATLALVAIVILVQIALALGGHR